MKKQSETHYLLLWAIRESTGSIARRMVTYSGGKHIGIARSMCQFQNDLGTEWVVYPQITTREHFEMKLRLLDAEHEKWNSLLR
jgi:hypothetical protein